jgi:hypothetical protein
MRAGLSLEGMERTRVDPERTAVRVSVILGQVLSEWLRGENPFLPLLAGGSEIF